MTHRYESVADLDARSERLRTSCGDGHIVWRRWGVGIPVILLHGGSGSWTHWVRTIPALAAAGFEVIAPDLPGLGDSAMPPPPLTPASSADALLAGWRNIVRDAKPVRLVGFSFGANVGVFFAAGLADQCASFTISGCAALGIPHLYVDLVKERSSMSPATLCVKVLLLPVPFSPTTSPKPNTWLVCAPSRSVMSLMRTP